MEKYKPCKGCNQVKPYSAYYLDRRPGRTVQSRCIECQKAYRLKNIDKDKANKAAYYQANKLKYKGYHKKRYSLHGVEIRQKVKNWRLENPKRFIEQQRNYRQKNSDKHNEACQKRRAQKKNNGIYKITKTELKRLYSSPCFYCGSKEKITLDHVMPIALGGRHSIGNIVPACKSCNSSKSDSLLIYWLKR